MQANQCILLLAQNDPQYSPKDRELLEWWLELPTEKREAIMDAVTKNGPVILDRVMSRSEVAHAFRKSVKWVDWIAKQPDCPFRRIRLGSSRRSCGFSALSVMAALEARNGK